MEQEAKLAALAAIAKAFNAAGIVWGLGASALLYYEGVVDTFADLDLFIQRESMADAQRVLLELGAVALPPAPPSGMYATAQFQEYAFQGVDLDLLCGFAIRRKEGIFSFPFDETCVARHALQDGVPIPLCALADWYVLYLLMSGREKKAALVAQALKATPTAGHRAWLSRWLRHRLPGDVRERVLTLYTELSKADGQSQR